MNLFQIKDKKGGSSVNIEKEVEKINFAKKINANTRTISIYSICTMLSVCVLGRKFENTFLVKIHFPWKTGHGKRSCIFRTTWMIHKLFKGVFVSNTLFILPKIERHFFFIPVWYVVTWIFIGFIDFRE